MEGYYNVKMLLFRPFLSHFTRKLRHTPMELEETIAKCLDAAMKTIQVIYDIYRIHTFFRCWYSLSSLPYPLCPSNIPRWYNTTYVMFATSTLLLPMSKLGMCAETIPLRRSVEMAVEILEAMDESVVARKSVEIIKHYLRDFRPIDVQTTASSNDGNKIVEFADPGSTQTGFDIPVCSCLPVFQYQLFDIDL